MKVAIVLFAILAVSYGAQIRLLSQEVKVVDPEDTKSLRDLNADLQDYLDLFDEADIVMLVLKYLEDREFQKFLAFLFSPEFASLFNTLHSIPEFQQFMNFLDVNGIDVWRYDATIRDFLGIPPRNTSFSKSSRARAGLQGFLEELLALLPADEARALTELKLETSPAFAELHAAVKSEESANILAALRADPTYQETVASLHESGVDFGLVIDFIRYVFIL